MAEDTGPTTTPGAAEVPAQSDIIARSAGGEGPLSAREAALSLVDTRNKDAARDRREDEENSGEARDRATADQQSAPGQEPGAGTAQETGPGETQADDQGADKAPPIDPPRSWTKEDKELFKHLPRETQERLAERERSREADFLRRQNEASERLKGLSAQQQEADKARAHYEQALPALLMDLQSQHQGDFADIKGIGDIERLAREDWPRYVMWDAQLKKIAAIQNQVVATQARQAHEQATRWTAFAQDEDAKFVEKAPEFTDAKVIAAAFQQASDMLEDFGFAPEELGRLWNGQDRISLRDHRMQLLLRDGVKYREAQAKAKAALERPVPHVQRPGPAPARDADADEKVRSLNDRLTTSGTLRDAAALLVAQRQAKARR
jgi:hypothetical protein